jgi:hypothetical protein
MDEADDVGRRYGDVPVPDPWFRVLVDRTEPVLEGATGTILRIRVFLRGGLVLSTGREPVLRTGPVEDNGDPGGVSPFSSPLSRMLSSSSPPTMIWSSSSSGSTIEGWGDIVPDGPGSLTEESAGVSLESRLRLCTSTLSSSSFSTRASQSSTFWRGETGDEPLEFRIPLDRDNDLNDAALDKGANDDAGEFPARFGPGVTAFEAGGRLRERTLTRIDECMLILSLLLSASLPGRRRVEGR